MRSGCLLVLVLFVGSVIAQESRTYGFVSKAGIKSADCSFADNVKGCQLFNELLNADDSFAGSFWGSPMSLACFVTDDPSQSSMFFVFSLDPKSKLPSVPSTLTIYKDGLPANIDFFVFARNQAGAFDLKPQRDENLRGSLDEGLFSFHQGVWRGTTKAIDWDYWYFDINMKTGRFSHGTNRKISAGRCLRHEAPSF